MAPSLGTLSAVSRVSAGQEGAKRSRPIRKGSFFFGQRVSGGNHCVWDAVKRTSLLAWQQPREPWATRQSSECVRKGQGLRGREKTATFTRWPLLPEGSKKATSHVHPSWPLLASEGSLEDIKMEACSALWALAVLEVARCHNGANSSPGTTPHSSPAC